eukprot:Colp12_sorted_trinity150504_noHs@3723
MKTVLAFLAVLAIAPFAVQGQGDLFGCSSYNTISSNEYNTWIPATLQDGNVNPPCLILNAADVKNRKVEIMAEMDASDVKFCVIDSRNPTSMTNPPRRICGSRRLRDCRDFVLSTLQFSGGNDPRNGNMLVKFMCQESCESSDQVFQYRVRLSTETYDTPGNMLEDWCTNYDDADVRYPSYNKTANLAVFDVPGILPAANAETIKSAGSAVSVNSVLLSAVLLTLFAVIRM